MLFAADCIQCYRNELSAVVPRVDVYRQSQSLYQRYLVHAGVQIATTAFLTDRDQY